MSLPKLQKDISEHPSKNAVTAPSDPRTKEADIDRKMRLYGIIQGFRQGKLPSNRQIDETLDYFVTHAPFETSKLSREGQELIEGFRKVVKDAKEIVRVKNQDELVQNFIWNTSQFDARGHAENIKGVAAPVSKGQAQSEGQQAVEHLKTIAKLVFTNSEVRKLLSDITVLGRDVAADAAAKVAEVARPDEESLRKADEPAPDSQWIAPDGSTRGPNESAPDTGVRDRVEQAKQKKEEVKQDAKSEAQDQANRTQERAERENIDPNDKQQQKAIAKDEAGNIKDRVKNVISSRVPDDRKDQVRGTAQEQKNKTVDYLKEKFPEERQDRFIYRLKKVVVEQQQHDDFNQAVDFFFDMADQYKGRAKDVSNQGADKGLNVRSDPAYQNAEMELRILLERFANNTSMQPIFDAIDVLYTDAQNDDELRKWWHNASSYARRVIQEEGYIMEDQCNEDGKQLRESGRKFWDERYRAHREELFHSIEEFFLAYNEDPLNKQLGVDVKQLVKDLALDGDGNLKYKPHLINDLRHVIIPAVATQIGYVPIPRAEYTDNQFDIVIENLNVEVSNLLPNIIEIENRNYFKLSPYGNMGDFQQHGFTIGFTQIQADLRDVAFYFKKKTGFPKLQDQGLADVLISGEGISGKIHLETTPNKGSIFKVAECTINIHELKFKIRDSKHNFLYNALRHTATGLIKKSVATAMQVAIRQALVQLDQQLTDIRDTADEGKRRDDLTRTEAIKQRMQQKKEKSQANKEKTQAKAEERNSQFKIVTQREQELVNWESKNSYVGKEGAMKEHATTGDANGWKSPVFDVTHTSPTMRRDIVDQNIKQY